MRRITLMFFRLRHRILLRCTHSISILTWNRELARSSGKLSPLMLKCGDAYSQDNIMLWLPSISWETICVFTHQGSFYHRILLVFPTLIHVGLYLASVRALIHFTMSTIRRRRNIPKPSLLFSVSTMCFLSHAGLRALWDAFSSQKILPRSRAGPLTFMQSGL